VIDQLRRRSLIGVVLFVFGTIVVAIVVRDSPWSDLASGLIGGLLLGWILAHLFVADPALELVDRLVETVFQHAETVVRDLDPRRRPPVATSGPTPGAPRELWDRDRRGRGSGGPD
jgi:hypothetical protein